MTSGLPAVFVLADDVGIAGPGRYPGMYVGRSEDVSLFDPTKQYVAIIEH